MARRSAEGRTSRIAYPAAVDEQHREALFVELTNPAQTQAPPTSAGTGALGNTSDNTTLAGFVEKIEKRYGRSDRVWIMDRGIPTEATLATMREGDAPVHYLVGTPKGRLTKLEEVVPGPALASGGARASRSSSSPRKGSCTSWSTVSRGSSKNAACEHGG